MSSFEAYSSDTNIKDLIKSLFDAELPLDGDWGYSKELATIIQANYNNIPIKQLEHMVASMRTYLEMNITQVEEDRYGNINVNETSRKQKKENDLAYDIVTYEITAMKESIYASFISEYKEGYQKKYFNLDNHFKKRKEATLTRKVIYYFNVSSIK